MTGMEQIEALRTSRPDMAITVSREYDPNFAWDGDGPDPIEDGYLPYDGTVRATTIRKGNLIVGEDVLGGSYYAENEPAGEIHGYLPQMIDEALKEMDAELKRQAA